MRFKTGDRVRFLNDTGEGIITRIIDEQKAMVENSDGFEIPVLIKELVPGKGTYEKESGSKVEKAGSGNETVRKKKQEKIKIEVLKDEEIVLAFVPSSGTPELKTYLVNSSSYDLYFTLARSTGKVKQLIGKGRLEPGLKVFLGKYLPDDLNTMVTFNLQMIFFKEEEYLLKAPVSFSRSIPAEQLVDGKMRVQSAYFDLPVLQMTVEDFGLSPTKSGNNVDPEILRESMLSRKTKDEPAQKVKKGPEEVDLHIEKLAENHQSLSPAEILDIQLGKFRISLESAIIAGTGKIVFIHGVGNGKLRYELRKILELEYKKLRFQDASFREYGYGATMVYIP